MQVGGVLEVSFITASCEHIRVILTKNLHDFPGDIHVVVEMVVNHDQLWAQLFGDKP